MKADSFQATGPSKYPQKTSENRLLFSAGVESTHWPSSSTYQLASNFDNCPMIAWALKY